MLFGVHRQHLGRWDWVKQYLCVITLSRFTARTWLRIERVCCCTLRDSITMWYCLIESTVVAEARCLFYKVGASERCGRAWCRKVMANTCMHTNEHAYWFCVPDLVQVELPITFNRLWAHCPQLRTSMYEEELDNWFTANCEDRIA